MQNYYFNTEHTLKPFTHALEANENTLPPTNALRIAPDLKEGYWPCEKDGAWVFVEDHRCKTIYSTLNPAITEEVADIGEVKAGFTLDAPPSLLVEWDGKKWVESLDLYKKDLLQKVTIKYHQLYNECHMHEGHCISLDLRDILRSKIQEAEDFEEEDITIRVGDTWLPLGVKEAKDLRLDLVKRARFLENALKAHEDAINVLVDVKAAKVYDVETGW